MTRLFLVFLLHFGHSIFTRYCSFSLFLQSLPFIRSKQTIHGIKAMSMSSLYIDQCRGLYWLLWWHCRFLDPSHGLLLGLLLGPEIKIDFIMLLIRGTLQIYVFDSSGMGTILPLNKQTNKIELS